ncbi:hypothetical protein GCM10020367_56140 [Streptomyces sannanensis]|uniref:Type ISP restriction-modification enzyme LLaBIII C-terminal specificity domain-containing protein n=1 Tax=Streptomyces sannanensis TaxID=285536 RepID=A0ABP6SK27_9ACTN
MTATRTGAPGGDTAGAPPLDDLMPWSTAPPRTGRAWVLAPDARTLRERWDRLVTAEGTERERLFGPTRSRTPRSTTAALPGHATSTTRFAYESGPCPAPVRVLRDAFDEQWLIPDHRLIDAARPELWRVADGRQLFMTEQGAALVPSAVLPLAPGRVRPLYRRPGGVEPNLAPGLLTLLSGRYGRPVTAESFLAWTAAAAVPSPTGYAVPLTADTGRWEAGVELGHRIVSLQLRGTRDGERPRLPGGRRPYVRAALPPRPRELRYDPEEEVLHIGEGRISPVPAEAWDFHHAGERVLERWFAARTTEAEPGTLEALGPRAWPQQWTSELLELITVLALLGELRPRQEALRHCPLIGRAELHEAGVLPVPAAARRPASVLGLREEGPDGQFALI